MPHLIRRRFLSDSTIAAAALATGSASSFISNAAEALAADTTTSTNDRLSVMVCGVRSRGWTLTIAFAKNGGCRIKYICDVDEAIGQRRVDDFEKQFGYRPAFVRDMRGGLDDKDLDTVAIATPNHWHALAGIWAMQAGKDVEHTIAHLNDNGVDLNETPMTLGPMLKMDAKTETFTNNNAANAMLTRKYRKNFEVSKTEI